ncbi:MAG: dipeptide ABC transporter ATP-binding protein [Candidatus Izemoplasmatales bacterium]|nr:dipeptide ABC transporter ATP-binding protein [Candidatus Izemoplasmatales bacterium]
MKKLQKNDNIEKKVAVEPEDYLLSGKNSEHIGLVDKNKDILVVKEIKKYFPIGQSWIKKNDNFVKAVDGVSFSIKQGKTLGVVGESGCGKTTLGRTILRLNSITAGSVLYDNIDLRTMSKRDLKKLRPKIQIIFQDPYSSLSPRMTIGEIIGEAVREHKIVPKSEFRDYILGIMKSCGLPPYYYSRYPHEFSGGQRQRICIARALALKPDLIVCDEPVSALDVSIQAQIINLLVDLQNKFGLTYMFISHDLSVVEYISDEIMVMYLGSVVEYGTQTQIFKNTMHPYTSALLSAVPVPDPDVKNTRIILQGDIPSPANPPKGCKFHTRCSKCMEICKTVTPVFKEYEPGHKVACHLYSQE